MSLKQRWLIFAVVFVAQALIAAHGIAQWRERERRPVRVAAAVVVTRETPSGAWLPIEVGLESIRAGDRIQVNLRSDQPVQLYLLHLRGPDQQVVRLHPAPGAPVATVEPETFVALPSPTTWYSVDRVSDLDRLVLVASRPKDGLPDMPATLLSKPTGNSVYLQVPLPDGRVVDSNLVESQGARAVRVEWNLGR